MAILKNTLLIAATLSLCNCANMDDVTRSFDAFDQDSNQRMSYAEFHTMMMINAKQTIASAFNQADTNKDKLISRTEAQIFEPSDQEYQQADKNGSGQVDWNEFHNAYTHYSFIDVDTNHDGFVTSRELASADLD